VKKEASHKAFANATAETGAKRSSSVPIDRWHSHQLDNHFAHNHLDPHHHYVAAHGGGPIGSFYSQECNARKKCPKEKYCSKFLCEECLAENMACTGPGQCCEGHCTYGRCKNVPKKSLGTFCDRHDDCQKDGCCLRVAAVNKYISICKPKLEEFQICGPHSPFSYAAIRMAATGAEETMCGPCKDGLKCTRKGIFGELSICSQPTKGQKSDDKKNKNG